MPELNLRMSFSAAEIAHFERIARIRGCTFAEAIEQSLRAALADEPDDDAPKNVLFFPITGDAP